MSIERGRPLSAPVRPGYWSVACDMLAETDAALAGLAARYRNESLMRVSAPFSVLCAAIAGQQISVKAADSIRARFRDACGGAMTPEAALALGEHGVRACGFTAAKTATILRVARFFSEENGGRRLQTGGEREVRALLTGIKGIGDWTADMYLIFRVLHPDIFPAGDIGVLAAMERIYGEERFPRRNGKRDKAPYIAFAERWAPYRTTAVWLLWRSLDPFVIQY